MGNRWHRSLSRSVRDKYPSYSLRSRYVWFLKWETFPWARIFISLLPRFAQNEQKEIGDVKTYGMLDKIHFGPLARQVKWLKRCFYNRSTSAGARFITADEVK